MFPFAGYITGNENTVESDTHYFSALVAKFPSIFSQRKTLFDTKLSNAKFSLFGDYEAANESENQDFLLFYGELFNYDEIASTIPYGSKELFSNAALVHSLILKNGIEAIKKINGQFLIIYYNQAENKIHIINDHFGISQLYYYSNKNIFLFASELKFILAHPACPREIDWESSLKRPQPNSLNCHKSYKTWFKEINLLSEASILSIDVESRRINIKNYWNEMPDRNYDFSLDERTAADVKEEYISLLEDAVKIRVAADEVCYSLLSGGLDSSAIVALAAKYKPVETFSIITQTTWLEGTTSICNKLKHDLGIKNRQYLMPVHQLFFNSELWKQQIWRAESPVNHTDSFTKTLLHYAIKKGNPEVKALLTGTGSDQFNGGLAKWLVQDTAQTEGNWEKFHNAIIDTQNRELILREDEGLWERRDFINRDFLISMTAKNIETNAWMFYIDRSLHSQAYSLLWDEVRASNYHGHTTRFPFLDFRFLPFISKIPPRLHKDLFLDKAILRTALKGILPDYVISKPKAPFLNPQYDYRCKLFKFLTGKDSMKLVEEALGEINKPHPVINKMELVKRLSKMQQEPDIFEWLNIIYIINLGLLEKLPDKTEMDMDIESSIEELQEVIFEDDETTKVFLDNALAIKKLDLQKPLRFSEGASLLFDKKINAYFLSKDNELKYEIEDTDWANFLNKVDNQLSIQQIMDELQIEYAKIEEFLNISISEEILSTQE